MGFDRKKLKQIRQLMVLAAALVLALMYSSVVFSAISMFVEIMKPFIYGGVIAFVLNIPMCQIEGHLLAKWQGKSAAKAKRPVSIILSLLFVILLITIVIATVAPQVAKTAVELGNKIPAFADRVVGELDQLSANYPQIQSYVDQLETITIDWDSLFDKGWEFLRNGMSNVLFSTFSVAGSIIGGFLNGLIGFIFALYILGQKETLGDQCRRVIRAYTPERVNRAILKVCSLVYRNFSNFISGQCLEACVSCAASCVASSVAAVSSPASLLPHPESIEVSITAVKPNVSNFFFTILLPFFHIFLLHW